MPSAVVPSDRHADRQTDRHKHRQTSLSHRQMYTCQQVHKGQSRECHTPTYSGTTIVSVVVDCIWEGFVPDQTGHGGDLSSRTINNME